MLFDQPYVMTTNDHLEIENEDKRALDAYTDAAVRRLELLLAIKRKTADRNRLDAEIAALYMEAGL